MREVGEKHVHNALSYPTLLTPFQSLLLRKVIMVHVEIAVSRITTLIFVIITVGLVCGLGGTEVCFFGGRGGGIIRHD